MEASAVAEHTEKLVKLNGCEGVVTVFKSRAEELTLPSKVDVLVSEWMGNCLLVRTKTKKEAPYRKLETLTSEKKLVYSS